jgi:hypothetical protein
LDLARDFDRFLSLAVLPLLPEAVKKHEWKKNRFSKVKNEQNHAKLMNQISKIKFQAKQTKNKIMNFAIIKKNFYQFDSHLA